MTWRVSRKSGSDEGLVTLDCESAWAHHSSRVLADQVSSLTALACKGDVALRLARPVYVSTGSRVTSVAGSTRYGRL